MEKFLRTAVAVLGFSIVGSAKGEDRNSLPAPQDGAIVSVASPLMPVSPILRRAARVVPLQPTLDAGQGGGTELAGAFVIGLVTLWSARRRRIV